MVRKIAGPDAVIYTDVNQLWDVDVSMSGLDRRNELALMIPLSIASDRVHASPGGPQYRIYRRTNLAG